jgi:pimeloyl-[acyl-carrier protein] synthase
MPFVEKLDNALFKTGIAMRAGFEWANSGILFDPTRPALRVDPYPFYRRLRERDPVHRSYPASGWVLSRYEDILAVLGDRRYSSDERNWKRYPRMRAKNRRAGIPDAYETKLVSMLRSDPPDHTRLRGLVSKAFTPRAVERMRPRLEAVVTELLDAVEKRGEMELVRDFGAPLPVTIIAEMLGIPTEDRDKFRHWSDEVIGTLGDSTDEVRRRSFVAVAELHRYLEEQVALRRKDPRDDLLSGLVAAEEEGTQLSLLELLTTCVLLLVAGNETTTNLIGNGLLALLANPEQLALLREEPKRIPAAIEELLRFDSPVQLTSRLALDPGQIAGHKVRPGQQIVLLLGAGNRDPARFPEPDRLDVTRENVRHLSFSHGAHFCLGAQLARLEAEVAFTALFERLDNIRLAGPLTWSTNTILRGPRTAPLRFDARR